MAITVITRVYIVFACEYNTVRPVMVATDEVGLAKRFEKNSKRGYTLICVMNMGVEHVLFI